MTIAIVAAQGHDNAGRRKACARASAKARLGHDKAHEFAWQRAQRRRCLLPSPPVESSRRGHQHNRGKAAENFQAGARAIVPRNSLKRLYDAIENGSADVSDPMLKERVTELKSIRDQARGRRGFVQNLRQPGPQAHADRVGRLPPRSSACAGRTRRSRYERSSHRGVEKRAPAHARRGFKRKNGGLWSAQFCTEMAPQRG
jgi:hypothetical protein